MISNYEKQYIRICENILRNGYYDNNRTGTPTYKLPHQIIQVNLQEEFPILKSKFVAFKTAVKEILWIMQGNNNVKELQEQNVHIWDEWEMEDGTIGTSYGWVVKNYDQINNLIKQLKTNPQDRRMMINLWQWDYLDGGALYPCCWATMWDVTDGKLNCMLVQRSGDMPLGVPFNTTQYAVLVYLIAQCTGLKVGLLTHVINNAHIYENQVEGIKKQLKNYLILKTANFNKRYFTDKIKDIVDYIPKLQINSNIKNFENFTIEDIFLNGYSKNFGNMGKIDMPVSV